MTKCPGYEYIVNYGGRILMKHIDKQSIDWSHLILKSGPEYLGTPLPKKSLCNEQNDVALDDISRIIAIRIE